MGKKIGWILMIFFGLFFTVYMIDLFVFLTENGISLWERIVVLLIMLFLIVGVVCLCKLLNKLGARLRTRVKAKAQNENTHTENTVLTVSAKESKPVGNHPNSLPKKLKQKSDTAKEQEIVDEGAAKRAEIKKIYQDFINGEGRLPEGFSEKYNKTLKDGFILHGTPFEEYLPTVDALHDRTGISDWIYFDGHIEINAAIDRITDWVRRHREMNTYLKLKKSEVGFMYLVLYCDHGIMVVMENGDAFRNVTEKSIASCKAERISFCTILSECELYDLIEHKVKTIEYITYPNYHDETYADWWFKDSPVKQGEPQPLDPLEKRKEPKAAEKSQNPFERAKYPYEIAGPEGTSQYEEESSSLLFLSDAHLAGELSWGQQEYFAVNTETWQPFYIISQYDGDRVARTWYYVKEAVDWAEVENYGDPVCKCQLSHRPNGKWKDMVVQTKTSANSFRIWWRLRKQYNMDVEIQVKENAFLLISYPNNPSTSPKEKELPFSIIKDKATFRDAVSKFGIYKEYIIQMLWDFCLKTSKSKIASTAQAKSGTGGNEMRSVKKWVNILGKPGDHGDVVRIGFGAGKCYLEITNDGFPYGNAGGFVSTIPGDVVRGKRLDARKFEQFYRSVYPGGEAIDDYSDPIWIYEPTPGRPDGNIEILKHLSQTEKGEDTGFSFERSFEKRDVVKVGDQVYLCVTNYACSAEANGRPVYTLTEHYHLTDVSCIPLMTAESGLRFAIKSAAYRYEESGNGALF